MINTETDSRKKMMLINSKNQVSFLPVFKRVFCKIQWLHSISCIPRKRNFKKEDNFIYNHSEIMLKMTVEIFYNRMFCFSSFLEIRSYDRNSCSV